MRGMASLTGHRKLFIRNIQEFQIPSNLLFDPLVVLFVLPQGVMDGFVVGFDAAGWLGPTGEKLVWSLCLACAGRGHLGSLDLRHIITGGTPSLLDALLPRVIGCLRPGALGWSSRHMDPGAGWVPRKGSLIARVDRYLACPVFSVMLGTV